MRVVHLSVYPPHNSKHTTRQSGVANYTKDLAESLQLAGVDTVVLCEKINGAETYTDTGVEVIRCFDRKPWFVFPAMIELARLQPQLLHIQLEKTLYGSILSTFALQVLVAIVRLSGVKVVTTIHAMLDPVDLTHDLLRDNGITAIPLWIARVGIRTMFQPFVWWSNTVVVHNQKLYSILSRYTTNRSKLSVISHGVEDLTATPISKAKQQLSLQQSAKTVLFLGFVNGYKGVDLLIEGFAEYCKHSSDAMLMLCATPSPNLIQHKGYITGTYNRLRTKAHRSIPAQNLRWQGVLTQEDIELYYSAADVIIFPYTYQIGASGPMALALGYSKPYLVSAPLGSDSLGDRYLFDTSPAALSQCLQDFFARNTEEAQQLVVSRRTSLLWKNLVTDRYIPMYTQLL